MRSHKGTRVLIVLSLAAVAFMAAAGAADAKKHHKRKHRLGPLLVLAAGATTSGNGGIATQTATCPRKTRAVGGGFSGTPANNAILPVVYESQKVGQRAWRAPSQIADTSGPGSVTLTVFVECRRNAPVTTAVATTIPTADTSQVGPSATASCPKGKLQAGGFAMDPPLNGSTIKALLLSSTVSGPLSWESSVISDHSSTLTSFAYCGKAKKTLHPVTATVTGQPTSGTASTAVAACTGRPQSGGFSQTAVLAMGGGYFLPYESRIDLNTWRVSATHIGTGPEPLTATALCG